MFTISPNDLLEMFHKFTMTPQHAPETRSNAVFNPRELTVAQLLQRGWSLSLRPDLVLESKLTWPTWHSTVQSSLKEIGLMPEDVDGLPEETKLRIIRVVKDNISLRLQQHVLACEPFTLMIEQLQTLTVGELKDPSVQVERELCTLRLKPGENLLEFLERFQLLLARASATGLNLRDTPKTNYLMAVQAKIAQLDMVLNPTFKTLMSFFDIEDMTFEQYFKTAMRCSMNPGGLQVVARTAAVAPQALMTILQSWIEQLESIRKAKKTDGRAKSSTKSKSKCYNCGKEGHLMAECWSKKKNHTKQKANQATEEKPCKNLISVKALMKEGKSVLFKDMNVTIDDGKDKMVIPLREDDTVTSGRKVARVKNTAHRILTGQARPIKARASRYSPLQRLAISVFIIRAMEEGIIRPSKSPWASRAIAVPKGDKSLPVLTAEQLANVDKMRKMPKGMNVRICIDYRALNSVTIKDSHPLLNMDDALNKAAQHKIFCVIDLKEGFYQIAMSEEDMEKTAFLTPFGLYEFMVMPFGLTNAPATFQRMIDKLMSEHQAYTCGLIDDICIMADTREELEERTRAVLKTLADANLVLNVDKCVWFAEEVKLLGRII
ncbi:Endonuclease [Ceratocystis platani]|uniref:Endonuclease n=1 Tax=Ceratocystis fimbriata f. sp. platani TaxID=88771 RepID=A0A0F8D8U4_CERFI|nr:Endonuclease [Ceratocystis platani]